MNEREELSAMTAEAMALRDELRQAIEEAEKAEPVAWRYKVAGREDSLGWVLSHQSPDGCYPLNECRTWEPLYTHPQYLRGLSVQDLKDAGCVVHADGNVFATNVDVINRAILNAARERQT